MNKLPRLPCLRATRGAAEERVSPPPHTPRPFTAAALGLQHPPCAVQIRRVSYSFLSGQGRCGKGPDRRRARQQRRRRQQPGEPPPSKALSSTTERERLERALTQVWGGLLRGEGGRPGGAAPQSSRLGQRPQSLHSIPPSGPGATALACWSVGRKWCRTQSALTRATVATAGPPAPTTFATLMPAVRTGEVPQGWGRAGGWGPRPHPTPC